jgi:hypothetical protein
MSFNAIFLINTGFPVPIANEHFAQTTQMQMEKLPFWMYAKRNEQNYQENGNKMSTMQGNKTRTSRELHLNSFNAFNNIIVSEWIMKYLFVGALVGGAWCWCFCNNKINKSLNLNVNFSAKQLEFSFLHSNFFLIGFLLHSCIRIRMFAGLFVTQ